MLSLDLARRLRTAGLRWRPRQGDRFVIDGDAFDGEVFTLSDMTIEAHEYSTGTVLGFNGTTEWALDSVAAADSLWLPREDQLRDLLGRSFRSMSRVPAVGEGLEDETVGYDVRTRRPGAEDDESHVSGDPEDAYALALLSFIDASLRLDD